MQFSNLAKPHRKIKMRSKTGNPKMNLKPLKELFSSYYKDFFSTDESRSSLRRSMASLMMHDQNIDFGYFLKKKKKKKKKLTNFR